MDHNRSKLMKNRKSFKPSWGGHAFSGQFLILLYSACCYLVEQASELFKYLFFDGSVGLEVVRVLHFLQLFLFVFA